MTDAQRREMVAIIAERLAGFADDVPATICKHRVCIAGRTVTVGEFRRYAAHMEDGR